MSEAPRDGRMIPPPGVSALILLHTGLAVGATVAAGILAHSTVFTLMVLFVALHSIERGYGAWIRGDDAKRRAPSDLLVLILAVTGVAAWAVSRLAEWQAGEQAGPGIALLMMIYATLLRDSLSDRFYR